MINGFQKTSLIDYPGNIVSTIFFGGCNFRCKFCHNKELVIGHKDLPVISEEEILSHLSNNKAFLDGVCIGGGEPTLYNNLPEFIKKIKALGLAVKLDTNGTNPSMVKALVNEGIIDYVALDIKAPWQSYKDITGSDDIEKVKETLSFLKGSSVGYEVRTTVVPSLHKKEDVIEIAKGLNGVKKYYLQQFQSFTTLDPSLDGASTYKKEELEELKKECSKFVPTFIRAKD